jgi:hypothetical protein
VNRTASPAAGWIAELRRLARAQAPAQFCELCQVPVSSTHAHLFDVSAHKLICCCQACSLLFGHNALSRYRCVPHRSQELPGFCLRDEQWAALAIPINIAFFVHSTSRARIIAVYPSPAGGIESLPELEAWEAIEADNPVLAQFEPDVEALLVNRAGGAREYFRASIDQCYELVGLIRTGWRGVSGGAEVWEAIGRYFAAIKLNAAAQPECLHA